MNPVAGILGLALAGGAAVPVHAAHPLATEDVYTQRKGNFQLEVGLERSRDQQGGTDTRVAVIEPVLSYGFVDSADLMVGIPYQQSKEVSDGATTRLSGKGDASVEVKWRFYESPAVSVAVLPGITLKTGDSAKGFGTGRITAGASLIATFERDRWTYHLHGGYQRNRNTVAERRDLLHLSGALAYRARAGLAFVAELGADSNTDPSSRSHPAFVLGGVIYSPSKDLDLDLGIRAGLNGVADDYTLLAGVTVRW